MVKMNVTYEGQLHCELVHESSGARIQTDAPKDNKGRGETFSPTDLMCAGLASCVLTTMAIKGEPDGILIKGAHATVVKTMTPPPRRIEAATLKIFLPASLAAEQRAKLEEIAHTCPAHLSFHPDVKIPMEFSYTV